MVLSGPSLKSPSRFLYSLSNMPTRVRAFTLHANPVSRHRVHSGVFVALDHSFPLFNPRFCRCSSFTIVVRLCLASICFLSLHLTSQCGPAYLVMGTELTPALQKSGKSNDPGVARYRMEHWFILLVLFLSSLSLFRYDIESRFSSFVDDSVNYCYRCCYQAKGDLIGMELTKRP